MPTWGELLLELQGYAAEHQNAVQVAGGRIAPGTPSPHDRLRRRYLRALHEHSGRAVIVYASAFLETRPLDPSGLTINLGDIPGFMETCSNIKERELDLIIHSPGGPGGGHRVGSDVPEDPFRSHSGDRPACGHVGGHYARTRIR